MFGVFPSLKKMKQLKKPHKKNCRILYIVGQLGPGGTERQLVCLLETMDKKNFMPCVVVWNFQDNDTYVKRIQDLGVTVLALPKGLGPLRKLLAFGKLVKKLKPEVIHSYCFYTNFAAFYGGHLIQAVAVGHLQSDFVEAKKKSGIFLGRLSARWPRTHISNNIMGAEAAKVTKSIFSPKKIFVVRNGVDLNSFKIADFPNFQKVRVLAIGSLLPVKRWDRLLKAAAVLKENGHNFLVRLVGVGPLRSVLEEQSHALGLSSDVEFLGYRNNIADLLADSHFLTHTSDREGCPNVLAEAMACGRAVVATDVGDVPFLIDDGRTGFVVDREDQEMLTRKMGVLLKNFPLCQQMGKEGREKAEKEFGLDRLVSETFKVYEETGWKG